MTADQQASGGTGSGGQNLENEVANVINAMSNTTVVAGLIVFGLLLDFIGAIVSIGTTPGTAAYSAALVLADIGNFVIVAVLFTAAFVKRDAGEWMRFAMLIAAAIILVGAHFVF
ncbi:MAG: hypothetical protein QXP70_05125 [Methanomassiliicoccales archaeon]